jgi:hypothetical protein
MGQYRSRQGRVGLLQVAPSVISHAHLEVEVEKWKWTCKREGGCCTNLQSPRAPGKARHIHKRAILTPRNLSRAFHHGKRQATLGRGNWKRSGAWSVLHYEVRSQR